MFVDFTHFIQKCFQKLFKPISVPLHGNL
ncbi:hypothetical protein Mgra_00003056 [Meloidogyne graminicola]|uniref:Uncharacterized protein n=1 Tax=Meloidogyne graminicola TaxID=189291 RepID=A0A8S9ZW99_9BILA|nr:hypothetical protein Mgra_00003056 [Meloidogyne graminicola]